MPTGSARAVTAPARLPPALRNRLVGILGRLGSDHDGERAAAGLLASRMLRERGLSWDEVVATPDAAPTGPLGAADAGRDLDLCKRHWNDLGSWMRAFVIGVSNQRRPLTAAQRAKLAEVAAELRGKGVA